jgi:uncharacterized protein YhbP (UPF0306 family)
MKKSILLSLLLFFSLFQAMAGVELGGAENNDNIDNTVIIARIKSDDIEVTIPSVIYTFLDTEIKLKFKNPEHTRLLYNNNKVGFIINGDDTILSFVNGECTIKKQFSTSDKAITIYAEEFSYRNNITPISLWYIIVPVLLLIGLIAFIMIRRRSIN